MTCVLCPVTCDLRFVPAATRTTLPKLTVTFSKNVQCKLIRARLTIDAIFNLAREATLSIASIGTFDPFWALVEGGLENLQFQRNR